MISGTIDRIFRDEDGRLWIVDFKTSEHEGGHIETFLSEEQRRYSIQLESYAAVVARLERGPIWLGLYFPLLDAWREWAFDAASVLAASK
jgi:ATP-dependent exoDNAse (exonuclease V) beta subunit